MIVYVESNFVLEIALGQEQAGAASHILGMAERGVIQIVTPTFGLSEPFSSIRQRGRDRQQLQQSMRPIERELRRAHHTQGLADALGPLGDAMFALESSELDRLESAIARVLDCAATVELNAQIYGAALRIRDEIDLDLEDSIIYACVLADLYQRAADIPKCFASRDARAFFDPAVRDQLQEYNCRYISRFPQAVEYITSVTGSSM